MKRVLVSVLVLGFLVSAANGQHTVFLVRHAEKAKGGGNDPELSAAGHTRATKLATTLKDCGITAIYATEFKRTQQTAAPLAKRLGIKVTTSTSKDSAAAFASQLRGQDGNVLVVGHSNTVPDLIKALGIEAPINIGDNEYDNLFVITLGEKPRLIRLHYGQ